MDIEIEKSTPMGCIKIPPSKSMAHRAIICASLSQGESIITNVDYSVDVLTTIECMKTVGARIEKIENGLKIQGNGGKIIFEGKTVQCNESGSTLRFMIPLLSLSNKKIEFVGKNRLLKRPQSIYQEIFQKNNLYFNHTENAIEIKGAILPGEYTIRGDVSSQFISGLLFTLPLLDGNSKIHVLPPFESKSYVNLTVDMLRKFGIEIEFQDNNTILIKGNQSYTATDYCVEGDFSQFAFWAVMSVISKNSDIRLQGVNALSLQGDRKILKILEEFGANVSLTEKFEYKITADKLIAREIDLNDCPDLGPILCILAMFSQGKTRIYNVQRLRLKESDRITAMVSECSKMGCVIDVFDNEIIVNGEFEKPTEGLFGWQDHRIIMACAVALTVLGGKIQGCEWVDKSYPFFFDDMKKLGIKTHKI